MFLTIPSIVGIAIVILALSVLALDIFILFIMWKGQLLSSSSSSIYILAFANIVCNCIQASITGLYLGPSVVLQVSNKLYLTGILMMQSDFDAAPSIHSFPNPTF
jgi:hypothetical protein